MAAVAATSMPPTAVAAACPATQVLAAVTLVDTTLEPAPVEDR
jgi:hypothetical protein